MPSITDDIRFEITGTSYERSMGADLAGYIYVGRIDFKITNTSKQPIKRLEVKAVWLKRGTSEVWDETRDYFLSTGDVPLKPGFSKSGYITSGKGIRGAYPDLVADIYVARYYGRYEIVREGLRVK